MLNGIDEDFESKIVVTLEDIWNQMQMHERAAKYNRSKYKATQQRPTAKTPSARRACGAGGDEVSTDTNG